MNRFRWTVLVCVGLLCVASVGLSLQSITAEIPTAATVRTQPVIVIDPGHGGADGGAISGDGSIIEKDINLSIALVLRDLFTASGYDVVMTRDEDISIHDEGVTSIKKQKTSDLHNRLALANAQPNTVFISIHQNKFGQASSWGAQVFHSPNNPESKVLAGMIQQEMIAQLQPENKRVIKEAGKNLYLMYEASCAAVLVECGFLSNPQEAQRLNDPEYQAQIAFVLYGSVLQYLAPPPRGEAFPETAPGGELVVEDVE